MPYQPMYSPLAAIHHALTVGTGRPYRIENLPINADERTTNVVEHLRLTDIPQGMMEVIESKIIDYYTNIKSLGFARIENGEHPLFFRKHGETLWVDLVPRQPVPGLDVTVGYIGDNNFIFGRFLEGNER